jgi:hypothetical protein
MEFIIIIIIIIIILVLILSSSSQSFRSRYSVIGVENGAQLDVRIPKPTDHLWGPPNLLLNGYGVLSRW